MGPSARRHFRMDGGQPGTSSPLFQRQLPLLFHVLHTLTALPVLASLYRTFRACTSTFTRHSSRHGTLSLTAVPPLFVEAYRGFYWMTDHVFVCHGKICSFASTILYHKALDGPLHHGSTIFYGLVHLEY